MSMCLKKTAGTMKSKEGKSSMEIDVLICKRNLLK